MTEKYGSGRFCSRYCANSKKHPLKDKEKISLSLLKYYNNLEQSDKRYCSICHKKIKSCNKTGLCADCLRHTPQGLSILSQNSKQAQEKLMSEGRHKGWASRKITSYAEKFWQKVLDNNNISYQRELPIKHIDSNYFLDFYIEVNGKKLDLEIDGKQHHYEDRIEADKIRDDYLQGVGYIVYRIPWNKITSEAGKQQMQEKISQFLEFYETL